MKSAIPPGIQNQNSGHPDWAILAEVEAAILNAFDGHERMGEFVADMLRKVVDDVVDTAGTGRRFIDELEKTEKTYLGTKVEILLRHRMGFAKGSVLDLSVGGREVDIKFTMRGNWMVPPEAVGQVLLLMAADESRGLCWMGLIKADLDKLSGSHNRDDKRTISKGGFGHIRWLLNGRAYEPNFWRGVPQDVVDAAFDPAVSGAKRMMRLFSMMLRRPIPRRVVQEVTQQLDSTRRVRANGGARDIMGKQVFILNGFMGQGAVANLGLPPLAKGAYIAIDARNASERAVIESSSQYLHTARWTESRPKPKGPVNYIRDEDIPLPRTDDTDDEFDGARTRDSSEGIP